MNKIITVTIIMQDVRVVGNNKVDIVISQWYNKISVSFLLSVKQVSKVNVTHFSIRLVLSLIDILQQM